MSPHSLRRMIKPFGPNPVPSRKTRNPTSLAQKRLMTGLACLVFAVTTVTSGFSQEEPEPYEPEEFPAWARNLRRAEIVALGSLPFTLLFTRAAYDLGRFAYLSLEAGAVQPLYAPWFFAPPDSPGFTRDEQNRMLAIAVSASALIAIADLLIGHFERREAVQEDRARPTRSEPAASSETGANSD